MVYNFENLPLLHDVMSQTFLIYRNTDDYWLLCCSSLLNSPPVVLILWVIGKLDIFTPKSMLARYILRQIVQLIST